jgi:hypothetical protein
MFCWGLTASGQEVPAAPEPEASPSLPARPPATTPAPPPPAAAPAEEKIEPPTWKDRGHVFLKKLAGPEAVFETVPGTIFDYARGFPRQWGRGGLGIAKRFGSQYGQFLVGETIEVGVSVLHREDPRYFRMKKGPIRRRIGHALVSTVIVRGVHGGTTLGVGRLANVYGGWAVATFWNPADQRNALKIFGYGSLALGIKAGTNAFHEFWPDVKKLLKR